MLIVISTVFTGSGLTGTAQAQAERGAIPSVSLDSNEPGQLVITRQTPDPAPTDYRISWAHSSLGFLSYRDSNEAQRGNAYPSGNENTLTLDGLTPGEIYKVQLRARYYTANRSAHEWSGPWTGTSTTRVMDEPAKPPPPEETPQPAEQTENDDPPAAPTGLTVARVGHSVLTLSWNDPQDERITGYRVLRGASVDSLSTIEENTGGVGTEYADDTVAPETTYHYAVIALSAVGDGAQSDAVSATTTAAPKPKKQPTPESARQTVTTFISNTGQTGTTASLVRATEFTTGTGTYTLSSVGIYLDGVPSGTTTPVVQIYGDTSDNPSTLLATMTNPGTFAANAVNTFTAPANTTLSASTTYWVVTSNSATTNGAGFIVGVVGNTTLDSGTAPGWSIGAARFKNDITDASWSSGNSFRILFAIRGTGGTTTNNPPTVANAIPDQSATAGTAFSYAFPDTTFTDADTGDTLSYTATKADDTALPTWLAFAASTRTFSGTPTAAGTVAVKVTASDGNGGSVSDTFDITVAADTTLPTLTSAGVNEAGLFILLGFSENLQLSNLPPASAFTVTAGGSAVTVGGVLPRPGAPDVFVITVSPAIRQGQAIVVTYTDPTAGDDATAFQDVAGNDAASFTTGSDGVPAVTNASTVVPATTATEVPAGWNLKPTGLTVGDQFRLLFLSSTKRDGSSTDIATYNTFVQARAAAGHADIRTYSAGFRAVGCTSDVDARDNTETTYTATDKGVPIYWLNGAKAADEYQDFYDESWDDEANDKNESGTNGPDTSQSANYPLTGCDHDGTEELERALGASPSIRVGRPNSSSTSHGPISNTGTSVGTTTSRPMYGLSGVFLVSDSPSSMEPAAVSDVVVVPVPHTTDSLQVSWSAPDNTGKPALTGYDVRYKLDSPLVSVWTVERQAASSTSVTIDGLDANDYMFVQVRAVNAEEDGPWSSTAEALTSPSPEVVLANHPLVPDDLDPGDSFRLLFVTSATKAASGTGIHDYNIFVSDPAFKLLESGNLLEQWDSIGVGQRPLLSLPGAHARLITDTTWTETDRGVPIYWLNGARVADDYADFYDGTWADEANPTNGLGNARSLAGTAPWTGTDDDGTELFDGAASRAVGQASVSVGGLGSTIPGAGPLNGGAAFASTQERPLYGLWHVMVVDEDLRLGSNSLSALNATGSSDNRAAVRAQLFTTGSHSGGYGISLIEFFKGSDEDDLDDPSLGTVALYTTDTNGDPDLANGLHATLSVVSTSSSRWGLAAPVGTVLKPSTTYALVFQGDGSLYPYLETTNTDGEDLPGAGWSIADVLHYWSGTSWVANSNGQALTMEILGPRLEDTEGPALASATVVAAGNAVTLVFGEDVTLPSDSAEALTFLASLASAFAVTGGGDDVTVSALTADSANPEQLTIGLSGVILQGQAVTLTYTDPTAGDDAVALQDVLGNETPTFTTGLHGVPAVINNSAITVLTTTVPGAPTGLTATASGSTQINLSWTVPASDGGSAITGYKIEVSSNGGSSWTDQVANTNSTATTYAHTGLAAGTTRHYRVSAINANGSGTASNVDSATTATTVPGAPSGLSATASGSTQIDLSWTAPAITGGSAITGYKIEVSPNGTSGWTDQVANTNSTATTYAHTGLASGDTRHYRVSAINANGSGAASNVDTATTGATAPGAPSGLTATASGSNRIDLSWSAPASTGGSAITGYKIEVSSNGGTSWTTLVADTGNANTTYQHTGLTAPSTRHYRVSAINANGSGTASNVDSATTAAAGAPSGLSATASGSTQINLSWSAPASDGGSAITGYKIEVSSNGGSSWTDQVANTGSTTTTYAHTGLAPGSTRHYRVSAINTNGSGTASNVDNATTGQTTVTFATLSALTVSPKDIIGFVADRTSYEVGVASTVTQATITATKSHSAATVAYSTTDADTSAGHQLNLSDGRNEVTITVTAEDTTTTGTYTVSINRGVTDAFGWKASDDFDGLITAENNRPRGMWSDGTTMWVTDWIDIKIYAYDMTTKAHDASKDFDTLDAAGNDNPRGIWSDGTTVWVSDYSDEKLYAYDMTTKARDVSKDFDTANLLPTGIWSDGTTMWVAAQVRAKIYAYDMSTKARDADKDFDTLEAAGNNYPGGIWSNNITMWVAEEDDDKLYAYNMASKARDADKDFNTLNAAGNGETGGIWANTNTNTMWASDVTDGKIYSYNMPLIAPNTPAAGTPAVTAPNVFRVPAVLSADLTGITDTDRVTGIATNATYKWQRFAANGTTLDTDSVGTGSTYTLTDADAGKTLKVVVSFTDNGGNSEGPLTSAATSAITAAAICAAPSLTGGATFLGPARKIEVGRISFIGSLMYGYSKASGKGSLDNARFTTAASNNYEIVVITNSSSILVEFDTALTADDRSTLVVHICDQAYAFSSSDSFIQHEFTTPLQNWAPHAERTIYLSQDTAAPTFASATVNGTSLVITLSEPLGAAASLANSAFTVKKGPSGSQTTLTLSGTAPVISGSTVTLTLASTSSVTATDTNVLVTYTKPGTGTANKLVDAFGNETGTFADQVVTNLLSTTVPDAPTALTATASGTTQIDLSWSAPASTGGSAITGYKIESSSDGGSSWSDLVANTSNTTTTYAHTGLTAGTTRHYRVSAINANGTGTASNVANATTGTTVPGAPSGLSATASGNTQINLSWTAPASTGGSAITGYKIEVSSDGGSSWTDLVANTGNATTTYAHTGLTAGTTRHYRVSALNANGSGAASNVDSATTGTTVPGAPTGLTATASGTTQIDLSWTAPASTGGSAITGYKIESSSDGGSSWSDLVADTGNANTTYQHTGLTASSTRHYRVSAINTNGSGTASNVDSATTGTTGTTVPGAPTSFSATASGQNQIDLSWSAPASGGGAPITGYRIEVSSDGGSSWTNLVANTGNANTTYAHTGLTAGDTRHYRVSAINANGAGPTSNVDSATTGTTVPGAPSGLTATPAGTRSTSPGPPREHRRLRHHRLQIEVSSDGGSSWDLVANTGNGTRGLPPAPRATTASPPSTPTAPAPPPTSTAPPPAPPCPASGLSATASGSTQINLSWSAPGSTGGSAITGYKIEVSSNGGSSWTNLVANTSNTTTTYAHTGLAAGTTRHYRVSAINTNGAGTASNVDSATTGTTVPGAPSGLTATASGTTAINLSWSAPASTGGSAITGYKIEVSSDGGSSWTDQVANTSSTTTTYAHTGLTAGTTRHYRVSAINTNGAGTASNTDSATTAAAGETTVTFTGSSYTALEGQGEKAITVELSAAPSARVRIPLVVTHLGGATAADYSGPPSNVTFVAGRTRFTFGVEATDDSHADGGESVRIGFGTLPAGYAPGARRTATVTLEDNDNADLLLNFGTERHTTVKVRESDTVWHRFTLSLSTRSWRPPDGNPQQPVTIPLVVTHRGGATPADYEVRGRRTLTSVTFGVGESVTSFSMRAIPDGRRETGEGLRLDFGPLPPGVSKGDWGPYETIAFVDQELPRVTASFGAESYTATEGGAPARVSIHLNEPVEIEPVEVRLRVERVGGALEADYTGIPKSVTFGVGEQTQTITVTATDDTDDDDGESVTLSFVNDPNGRVRVRTGPASATVALADNDGFRRVTVSFGAATYTATEGGADATVRVELDVAPGRSVTVPLTKAHLGNATAADYSGIPMNVTFAANQTSRTFAVMATADQIADGGESVSIGFGTLPEGVFAGSPAATTVTLADGGEQRLVANFGSEPGPHRPGARGRQAPSAQRAPEQQSAAAGDDPAGGDARGRRGGGGLR